MAWSVKYQLQWVWYGFGLLHKKRMLAGAVPVINLQTLKLVYQVLLLPHVRGSVYFVI